VCKLQARYFAGEIRDALEAVERAQALAWICGTLLQGAELAFYGALVHAASWDVTPDEERTTHVAAMHTYHDQLQARARHCPENFRCRAELVAAELARVEGRTEEATALYEAAARTARECGFQHTEALANELAGQFQASRGDTARARELMRAARRGYQQWGAEGKVRQLDAKQGEPAETLRDVGAGRTVQTSVEQLDLSVVLKVLEVVSGETDLDRLIVTVVRLALEQAGAARGLLLLPYGETLRAEAEASASEDGFAVDLRREDISSVDLPRTVLQQVLRTKESVLLHDASEDHSFLDDAYLIARKARSILCMPLLKQARLVGVLYLENPHVSHTFTPSRLALLKLLASEAAISLENARLYHDLQEREARMRRLVDANIIGIVLWHRDGRMLEANDAFLRMVGHDRQDLVTGRVRWSDLSPADWIQEDMRVMETVRLLGAVQAFEREVLRKDGRRVPVLVGAASFEGTTDEGVGYFLDLSESKRAEQIARDSERRNHDLQMRLADANRIASIGQLAAAIAHEINQPLAGIITNASTGTRMLAVDPVDVRAIGETIRRTLRDAERASEVIRRLRSLFTGHEPVAEHVDLNEIAESVTAMLALDFRRERIDLALELERGLPQVRGDRIQLQQVILNMLRNAAQAMHGVEDRPRKVQLRTHAEVEGRVQLSVTDSGQGLDPAIQGKLFEAFYTTKPDGMGVGLSVSRSIVERHEGRLWAESNTGPGATFAFSLPAVV
jgi:PAS domain S-box-containing protein